MNTPRRAGTCLRVACRHEIVVLCRASRGAPFERVLEQRFPATNDGSPVMTCREGRRVERVGVHRAQAGSRPVEGERVDRRAGGRAAGMEGQLAHEVRDHRLVTDEIAWMLRPAALVEVLGRGTGDHLRAGEAAGDEAAVERPPALGEDGDIEVLVDSLHRPGHRQLDSDPRIPGPERLEVLGELVDRERRWAEHAQLAARLGARGRGQRLGLLDLGQDMAHPLQVGLARVGERQPAGGAVDQPRAEVLLEVGDQPGHDRRREVQLARGAGEAALSMTGKKRIDVRRSIAPSSLFRIWQFAINTPCLLCLRNTTVSPSSLFDQESSHEFKPLCRDGRARSRQLLAFADSLP